MSRKKICYILVVMLLFAFMIYSLSLGLFLFARYPDYSGEFYIQLDRAYYQTWGDQLQVYAFLTRLGEEKSEPFEGDYYVLLLNTREMPATSFYNETETMEYSCRSDNGSRIYHNTTISALTTPIKEVVRIGDTIDFNLTVEVEEDLFFECLPFRISENVTMFRLRKGSNIISFRIKFTKGAAPHEVLAFYEANFAEGKFKRTIRTSYTFQWVFYVDFYKNMTDRETYIGGMDYSVWLLPFSARVISCQKVNVEHGNLFVSFPLNISLSADKISFALFESYIVDINPVAIYSSPPVTLPTASVLVLLYILYLKWRVCLLHLLRYKTFYAIVLLTGVLLASQYLQALLSDVAFPLILSLVCIGSISVGTVKNGFTQNESRLFWKTLSLASILLSAVPLVVWAYYLLSAQMEYEIYLKNVPVIIYFVGSFLGACVIGMIVSSSISYSAGFFLLISHLSARTWNRIQHKDSPQAIDASSMSEDAFPIRFSYYVSELFIAAIWFVILISSSAPVLSGISFWSQIWDFILESNLMWVLVPLWAFIYLLFLYELLDVTWYGKPIGPKSFHNRTIFSIFATMAFVVRVFVQGFDYAILLSILNMLYIFLLISSGFAIGFIGTGKIARKRSLKEITRIGKRYSGIAVRAS